MNFPALEITFERPDIHWFFMTQVNLRLGDVPSLFQDMGIFSKCLAPQDQCGSVKYSWHVVMTTSYTLKPIICKLIKNESSNQKQCCGCRWCRCRARESSVSALNLQWNACNRPPPAGSRLREGLNCAFSNCPVENKWACLRNQWQHLFIAAQSHPPPPPPPPAALGEPLPWRSGIPTNVWMWKWNSWRQWGALVLQLSYKPVWAQISPSELTKH